MGHQEAWQGLESHGRPEGQPYKVQASDLQEQRRAHIRERVAKHRRRFHELRQELAAARARGGSCDLLGRCRLGEAAGIDVNALYESPEYTQARVEQLRQDANQPLAPPFVAEVATLDMMDVPPIRPASRGPEWAEWLGKHREVERLGYRL